MVLISKKILLGLKIKLVISKIYRKRDIKKTRAYIFIFFKKPTVTPSDRLAGSFIWCAPFLAR